jgi:hypothetical protein
MACSDVRVAPLTGGVVSSSPVSQPSVGPPRPGVVQLPAPRPTGQVSQVPPVTILPGVGAPLPQPTTQQPQHLPQQPPVQPPPQTPQKRKCRHRHAV